MRAREILFLFSKEKIPLYDIRQVFEIWNLDFDRVALLDQQIDDDEVFSVLKKLKSGYPAAYIVGHVDLLSVRVFVNEDVLIPRMETEDFLHELLEKRDFSGKRILDLCTGSGFIALALKKRYPNADVMASDISEKALALAKKSAEFNNLDITFVLSDFLEDVPGKFDCIISNPPYIPEHSAKVLAPFEPKLALFSGKDGMDSYRKIFSKLNNHILHNGEAFFEIESDNAQDILRLASQKLPDFRSEVLLDFDQKNRFIHFFH